MKPILKYILILGIVLLVSPHGTMAQKKKKTTRIQVAYAQDHNRVETLTATVKVREKRYEVLDKAIVYFYSVNDTGKVLLDKITTNNQGEAVFKITDNPQIYKDPEGIITFFVEYPGNATNNPASKTVKVKQARMEVTFFQKDSIKSIEVITQALDGEGQLQPVAKKNIHFYVKGTFSLYNFGKVKTDEEGKARIAFPVDMPGDTTGVLTIVAKIQDDRTYGTIEARGKINWATPIEPVKEKKRGLGDTDAPLWMVYTLIILLSAVWFHYLYVIFLIVKIKLAGGGFTSG